MKLIKTKTFIAILFLIVSMFFHREVRAQQGRNDLVCLDQFKQYEKQYTTDFKICSEELNRISVKKVEAFNNGKMSVFYQYLIGSKIIAKYPKYFKKDAIFKQSICKTAHVFKIKQTQSADCQKAMEVKNAESEKLNRELNYLCKSQENLFNCIATIRRDISNFTAGALSVTDGEVYYDNGRTSYKAMLKATDGKPRPLNLYIGSESK